MIKPYSQAISTFQTADVQIVTKDECQTDLNEEDLRSVSGSDLKDTLDMLEKLANEHSGAGKK